MDIKNKVFYVYEWFNVDNGYVFYVGKGKNSRYKNTKQRNKYFINYYNKHKCDVRKVYEKLTEDEAFKLEIELIAKYKENGGCKCNISNGGEGGSYEVGSWNHLFRSLQYRHDVLHETRYVHNEEDYDYKNLKSKTTEELQCMYDELKDRKEDREHIKALKKMEEEYFEQELDKASLLDRNYELKLITDMIAHNLSNDNKKYEEYNKTNGIKKFYLSSIDFDDFLDDYIKYAGIEYLKVLVSICYDNFKLLHYLSSCDDFEKNYKLVAFNIKNDGCWHLRLQDKSRNYKHYRIKIHIKDMILAILMQDKNNKLAPLNAIEKEMMFAEIYY